MDSSVRKQQKSMNSEEADNPTSYLKALFVDSSSWNQELLFPDLAQEYCEVEGSFLDVSVASTVDNQLETVKTGHVTSLDQSGSNADRLIGLDQTYPVTLTEVPEPSGPSTMDQAYDTQSETESHYGSGTIYPEAMDVYSAQGPMSSTIAPQSTTIAPLPTTDGPLPTTDGPPPTTDGPPRTTDGPLPLTILNLPATITHENTLIGPLLTTDVSDVEDIFPLLADVVGTPDSLMDMDMDMDPIQTPDPMLQNPDQQTSSRISFTDGGENVQAATDIPIRGTAPLKIDSSHVDLADILQWIQGTEAAYQPNPTGVASAAATGAGGINGILDGNIPQLSGPLTTDSMAESGSIMVQLGSTTNPITIPGTEHPVVIGTPTISSSSELSEILNILSGSTNSADADVMSTQTMVDQDMDLVDVGVVYQQHTEQSSYFGNILQPEPEPEVMSTAVAAPGTPTTSSVKKGLKSKIQLKRLQRGEKELRVSFDSRPSGELTEEEQKKIDHRKQKNKDSANRSRLNREMKMKRLIQENAEAEKEVEMLKSEVEKTRKVRDVLQYWWDRRLCHVTTGFRKPPNHMGVNGLLDALEKYLASEAKD